jgi:uncharacterized repeat protein (TIGR01451 family)
MKKGGINSMKHKLGNIVLIAVTTALLGWADVQSARAATITVNNTADSGAGSLRDALAGAADGDLIDATGISGTITLTSGQLGVSNSVTIIGPGPGRLAVDGNAASRVFYVASNLTAVIAGLTVTNGLATNSTDSLGGGVLNDHSTLTVSNCIVSGNTAGAGGGIGISNFRDDGGSGGLTVIASTISGNTASIDGGGVYNWRGILNVVSSTLKSNRGGVDGGGIATFGPSFTTLTMNNCTVSGNTASYGGGAIASGSDTPGFSSPVMELTACTLSDNSAGNGGGIENGGDTTLSSCTFSGNVATTNGGGILSFGNLQIGNTILKQGTLGANLAQDSGSGTITSRGYNLSSDDGGGFLNATGDQINEDPLIGPLADNGGPTLTHLPLPGSPAIDQGRSDAIPALATTTDQRGLPRTIDDPSIPNATLGDGTDIGAVEVGPANLAISMSVVSSQGKAGQSLVYTITVTNAGPSAGSGVVVTDPLPQGTTFSSATPAPFSAPPVGAAGTVLWNIGTLASGSSVTCALTVQVSTKGNTLIANTASVTASSSDLYPANNTVTVTSKRNAK